MGSTPPTRFYLVGQLTRGGGVKFFRPKIGSCKFFRQIPCLVGDGSENNDDDEDGGEEVNNDGMMMVMMTMMVIVAACLRQSGCPPS